MIRCRAAAAIAIGAAFVVPCCSGPNGPADLAIWQAALGKEGEGALDGAIFDCKAAKGSEAEPRDEVIEFHGGRFHFTGSDEFGFTSGAYRTSKAGDVTVFQAETASVKEGRIQWRGAVRGDAIEGSFLWFKEGQASIESTFMGTRRR